MVCSIFPGLKRRQLCYDLMMKGPLFFLIFFSIFMSALSAAVTPANAFQFTSPVEGEKVFAGSTIKVRIEPGDIDPLFGVMLIISPAGIMQSKLDSLMPFEWSIKIPEDFHGPLRLEAVGRRYIPVPNPPRTTITVMVVLGVISISSEAVPLTNE